MSTIITASNLTAGTSNSTSNSFTTSSISLPANTLGLIGVVNSNAGGLVTPSISGWTQVAQVSVHGTTYMTVFRYLGVALSGTITITTSGNNGNGIAWAIDKINNTDTTGTNGSGAIVQSATNAIDSGSTVTGITATLGSFKNSLNATWGVCGMNTFNYGINSGSNFTNLGFVNTGGAPINSQYAQTNQTAVNWTWGAESANPVVAVAVEIKAPNFFGGGMI